MAEATKLLIDGDGLVFRCGFATEKTKYLIQTPGVKPGDPDSYAEFDYQRDFPELREDAKVWSRKVVEPLENAIFLVDNILAKLSDRFSTSDLDIWLSPPVGNFRERIAVTQKYKGNRDTQTRPKHYKGLHKHLVEKYGAKYAEGQEADDALGIGATLHSGAVLVSNDKDLDQIPGQHYNWVEENVYKINKKEGTINFYSQVLSGDTSDNIPGLSGVGPITARKMLRDCNSSRDCWEVVLNSYKDQFGDDHERRAIEVAQLCWVRRYEGEIWTPPSEKASGGETTKAA